MKKEWFYNYFDEVYMKIEQARSIDGCRSAEKEVNFIIEATNIEEKAGIKILDVGCGWGRHPIILKEKLKDKVEIYGIDINRFFIDEAVKTSERKKLNINWIQGDMRNLPSFLTEFDVIYMMNNTFGYFSDKENKKVLRNIHRALKRNGTLLFDTANRDQLLRVFKKKDWEQYKHPDGEIFTLNKYNFSSEEGMLDSRKIVIFQGKTIKKRLRLRVYTYTEVKKMLEEIGFTILEVWGYYDLSPFETEKGKMIFRAQK